MSRKTRKERGRQAAKAAASLAAANTLVWSFATVPMAAPPSGAADSVSEARRLTPASQRSEAVDVRIEGLRVSLTVQGEPGRHCAVFFRKGTGGGGYRIYPGAQTTIPKSGKATLRMNLSSLVGQEGSFKVTTAATSDFRTEVSGTEAVAVRLEPGKVVGSEKAVDAPLSHLTGVSKPLSNFIRPGRSVPQATRIEGTGKPNLIRPGQSVPQAPRIEGTGKPNLRP